MEVHSSVSQSVCPSVCPSVHSSLCLCVCLSVSRFIEYIRRVFKCPNIFHKLLSGATIGLLFRIYRYSMSLDATLHAALDQAIQHYIMLHRITLCYTAVH